MVLSRETGFQISRSIDWCWIERRGRKHSAGGWFEALVFSESIEGGITNGFFGEEQLDFQPAGLLEGYVKDRHIVTERAERAVWRGFGA